MTKILHFCEQFKHWFILGLMFIVIFLYYIFSPGFYGGTDNITHFLYSRYAFNHPALFLHPWARPLYTTLSAPFALLGFWGVQLFNVLLGLATAYFCFRIAKILKIRDPWMVLILVCFTPLYFVMMSTSLTEILFSFILVLSAFLFFRKNFIASAIVISFLPFARSEGFFLIPFFVFASLLYKQYKSLPFYAFGTLFFCLIGWPYYKEFFWVFTQFPYQLHHPLYNHAGSLWHFLETRNEVFGLTLELLFIAGVIQLLREIFSAQRSIRTNAIILFIIVLSPFLFYLAFHSILFWKGLGASTGMIRVLAAVMPLAALVCLKGFEAILGLVYFSKYGQWTLSCLVIILLLYTTLFRNFPFPMPQTPEEETMQRASRWIRESSYADKIVYYTDISTPFHLGVDFCDGNKVRLLYTCSSLNNIAPGSVALWDAHFGSNESQIPPDSILSHPGLRLIKFFKPSIEWNTFGGYPYECYVMVPVSPGEVYDNYAIRDSLMSYSENNKHTDLILKNSFEMLEPGFDINSMENVMAHSGKHSFIMNDKIEFSPGAFLPIKSLPVYNGENPVIKAEIYIVPPENGFNQGSAFVISIENDGKSYNYSSVNLKKNNLRQNKWNKVAILTQLSNLKSQNDVIKVYIWNPERQRFLIDDLKVELTY